MSSYESMDSSNMLFSDNSHSFMNMNDDELSLHSQAHEKSAPFQALPLFSSIPLIDEENLTPSDSAINFDTISISPLAHQSLSFNDFEESPLDETTPETMMATIVSKEFDENESNVVMAESVEDSDFDDDDETAETRGQVRPVHMNAFINFLQNAPLLF